MNRFLLCLCTFFFLANLSYGQRSRFPKEGQFPRKPGLIVSTNVVSLFEPEAGPTLGLEYRFALHWALAVDGTWMLYTMPELYKDDGRHTGYRIQPQIKYYFAGRHRSFNGYISLMATYKDMKYTKMSDGGQYYNGTQTVYIDPAEYTQEKKIIAGSANVGIQKFLDEDRHFLIEFYGGVGLRYKERKNKGLMDGVDYYNDDDFFSFEDGVYPHLSLGIKFGYRF
ncbi:Protein of unknown function [Chitinophaga sp. CF118]|uniref:DUF3575 domain-containing protein n=1 Tax=Chitinophaga sp. CF118 TaxID=1884367 RepID=UPI0008E8B0BB|nr:DUF3575 domain-containing protein [Chitinophaga sp. CF118]SFE05599.1 Protein of unknown function [Chitinophaga sp. CF118]